MKNEKLQAAEPERRLELKDEIIRASAGTGKTHQLSNRYLRLLVDDVDPGEILAATFTRKAAGEIRDRIIKRLAEAALDDEKSRDLAWEIGIDGRDNEIEDGLDGKRSYQLLRGILMNLHRLQIGTLDSFFAKIARSFSLEIGLPADWEIVLPQQIEQLQDEAVQAILGKKETPQLLHLMSKADADRDVSRAVHRTVTEIYQFFCEAPEDAWYLMSEYPLVVQDKLDEAFERISSLELNHKTFVKERDKDLVFISDQDWESLIRRGPASKIVANEPTYSRVKLTPEIVEPYRVMIKHARAELLNQLRARNESTHKLLAAFHRSFEPLKEESGALRFDDVTRRLVDLVEREKTNYLTYRLDNPIDHVLLDEFQDTSPVQWQVLRPFAKRVADKDRSRSFFCVGDMKQAIYGWRGGVAEIFDLVNEELQIDQQQQQLLNMSFRSSQVVIDTVNDTFENLKKYSSKSKPGLAKHVRGWAKRFKKHSIYKRNSGLPGYCTVQIAADSNRVQSFAAIQIADTFHTVKGKSIGVLVRDNDTVAELIFELHKLGIPASEEGGNQLTDSVAVDLILSAIQVADHPADTVAWYHLSNSPLGEALGVPRYDDWLRKLENPIESPGRLKHDEARTAAHRFGVDLRNELLSCGFGPTVERLARLITHVCTRRELARLQQLIELAFGYDDTWSLRCDEFVKVVRQQRVEDPSAQPVRVMTIHQAKGLEFDIVFLPQMSTLKNRSPTVVVGRKRPADPANLVCRYVNEDVQKLLPSKFQKAFDEHERRMVHEFLCVLYVAMTRAKHALHIVISPDAKTNHKSSAALVLSALVDGKTSPGEIAYSHGDPQWYNVKKQRGLLDQQPASLQKYYIQPKRTALLAKLAPSTKSSIRSMTAASPSSLEGGKTVLLKRAMPSVSLKHAFEYGTLIHGCFELVRWLDDGPIENSRLTEHLAGISQAAESFKSTVHDFQGMIKQPNLARILTQHSYLGTLADKITASGQSIFEALTAQVENERSFAVEIDGQILQGVIDRLVLIYHGDQLIAAEALDYKTDMMGNDDENELARLVAFYRPQVDAYKMAISRLTGLPNEKVFGRLIFVRNDVLAEISSEAEYDLAPDTRVDEKQLPPLPKSIGIPGLKGKQIDR